MDCQVMSMKISKKSFHFLKHASIAITCACTFSIAFAVGETTDLTNIALNHPSAATSVLELDFNGTPDYKYFTLSNPSRVVVDIQHADAKASSQGIEWANSPITKMRMARQDDGSLRIVLDLMVPSHMQVQQMNSALEHTLLLDFVNPPPGTVAPPATASNDDDHSLANIAMTQSEAVTAKDLGIKASPTNPAVTSNTTKTSPPKPVLTASAINNKHDLVVVIDPGHGGQDPGASGPEGEHEKDVVLAISRQLYQILSREPGIRPMMTRSGDYYLSLRERLDVARDAHADVFVAIHADAYENPYSHGASVYALSLKGASSEAARWLAAKENYSELGGVNLNGKDDMLRSVLIDLSQTATISSSLLLGQAILQDLGQLGALHHGDKVEQAPFVVLKSPDIPSVLVETGFISNPSEAEHLENPAYEQAVAMAIAQGLNHYFHEAPPVGA